MILTLLNKIFPIKRKSLELSDKYSYCDIAYETEIPTVIDTASLEELVNFIPRDDRWTLKVSVGDDEPVTLGSQTLNFDLFTSQIKRAKNFIENEEILVKLNIAKAVNTGSISIYNFYSFDKFVGEINANTFLEILNQDLSNYEFIEFRVLEEKVEDFYSDNIRFSKMSFQGEEKQKRLHRIRFPCEELTSFSNQAQYPYMAWHFKLVKRPSVDNNVSRKLDILTYVFCIIGIFDITSITDNILSYKLNGYKTIQGSLNVDEFSTDSMRQYLRIYDWIYSDSGNFIDKVGIVRNIFSIYMSRNSLEISEDVFASILSGYKTYLKENLDRYIEVRNKVTEQLDNIINELESTADKYVEGYRNTNFAFLSFFFSVYIFQIITTGKIVNIFSKDITIISFFLLIISLVYLSFLLRDINSKSMKLCRRYDNLKLRYQDLLEEEDIDRILRNDEEFNYEERLFKQRCERFTLLWLVTVVCCIVMILLLSSYVNWLIIWNFLNYFIL